MKKTGKPSGAVIWQGASELDGAPVVVVITGLSGRGSANRKTGGLVQSWILRADMEPTAAIRSGEDASICGACPHRGDKSRGIRRTCYVNVGQAPLSVYRAYRRGSYPVVSLQALPQLTAGRIVRIGSYGDPAAVPLAVWQAYADGAAGRTGYTHSWHRAAPGLERYCMASVDTVAAMLTARAAGWRTFRVSLGAHDTARQAREMVCPASREAGARLQCAECIACHGSGPRPGVVIQAHGSAGAAAFAGLARELQGGR